MKLTVEIKSSGTYLSTAEDVAAAKCYSPCFYHIWKMTLKISCAFSVSTCGKQTKRNYKPIFIL